MCFVQVLQTDIIMNKTKAEGIYDPTALRNPSIDFIIQIKDDVCQYCMNSFANMQTSKH